MKQVYGVWLPEDDNHFNENMMHENGDYQRDTFQAAMEYIKEPKIFYDIGAHVGLWSLMAHRAGFKVIKAYEPNDKTFSCLAKNTLDKENIEIHPVGIAQFDDERMLVEEDVINSGAVKLQRSISTENSVSCITLNHDNMHWLINEYQIRPHESLVKIDTEGMEAECVLGMDKIIYALRPVVCVEQRSNDDALKILQQMGMVIQKKVRKDWILTWKNQ